MVQHQNPAMRSFMRYVSLLGDWPLHAAVGLILLGFAWRRGSQEWTRIFLAMLLAMTLAGLTGTVIKRSVPRARPSVHTETRWGGPRFSSRYHSFPSGHVGASTAFFGVLFFARRRIGLACLSIPILIGFSRMYIGAHYLSDVICAAVIGTFMRSACCTAATRTSNSDDRSSNSVRYCDDRALARSSCALATSGSKVTGLLRISAWKPARLGRIIAPMKMNHVFAVQIVTVISAGSARSVLLCWFEPARRQGR